MFFMLRIWFLKCKSGNKKLAEEVVKVWSDKHLMTIKKNLSLKYRDLQNICEGPVQKKEEVSKCTQKEYLLHREEIWQRITDYFGEKHERVSKNKFSFCQRLRKCVNSAKKGRPQIIIQAAYFYIMCTNALETISKISFYEMTPFMKIVLPWQ